MMMRRRMRMTKGILRHWEEEVDKDKEVKFFERLRGRRARPLKAWLSSSVAFKISLLAQSEDVNKTIFTLFVYPGRTLIWKLPLAVGCDFTWYGPKWDGFVVQCLNCDAEYCAGVYVNLAYEIDD
jgi:hypothetical protein